MSLLLGTSDVLELVTLTADTISTHASFLTHTTSSSTPGSENHSIASANDVTTIIAAPSSGRLSVRTLIITCVGTSNTLTLRHKRTSGTTATLWRGAVVTGDILVLNKYGVPLFLPYAKMRDVQTFTSSGIWVKPTSFVPKFVVAICIGGGGGGGGGDLGGTPASVNTGGGGGGGGGAYNSRRFTASQLPPTVNIQVANGGIGGLGSSTSTAGQPGGTGGDSRFHTLAAYGGAGGFEGSPSGGNGGGAGGTAGRASGATGGLPAKTFPVCGGAGCTAQSQINVYGEYGGGAGGTLNTSLLPVAAGDSLFGGGGGGCGSGFIFGTLTATAPQPGGNSGVFTVSGGIYIGGGGGAAGTTLYGNGSNGADGDSTKSGQGGGGGGYSDNTTNDGGSGGNGGTCGGGGGGGGAAPNGAVGINPAQVGGKGGNGGRGEVRVYSY